MKRKDLEYYLNELLKPERFKDYGPNGLQIEGQEKVERVAFAVSATQASISEAISWQADTLIVHHGLFWRFHGVRTITGPFAKRVQPLVRNHMNLFGYHLPLDAHLEIGNAKCIADLIGLKDIKPFGDHEGMSTGVWGSFTQPMTEVDLSLCLEQKLAHPVIHSKSDKPSLKKVGIITGGANSGWKDAALMGLDAFITGEMSEHDWHESAEAGVSMFAAGHHATEKFGIQALMKKLSTEFDIETKYIDSANPA